MALLIAIGALSAAPDVRAARLRLLVELADPVALREEVLGQVGGFRLFRITVPMFSVQPVLPHDQDQVNVPKCCNKLEYYGDNKPRHLKDPADAMGAIMAFRISIGESKLKDLDYISKQSCDNVDSKVSAPGLDAIFFHHIVEVVEGG